MPPIGLDGRLLGFTFAIYARSHSASASGVSRASLCLRADVGQAAFGDHCYEVGT